MQKTPRTDSKTQMQEVIGMFIEYDARKGLNNQEITPEQIVLDFKPLQVKRYKDLSTSVQSRSNFCTVVACHGISLLMMHQISLSPLSQPKDKS